MIIMSVDLGKARTGLAVCDKTEFLASPYTVIFEKSPKMLPQRVAEAVKEAKAELVVVGLPKNMDGTEGESARLCRNAHGADRCQDRHAGRTRNHHHGAQLPQRHQHARQKKKKRRGRSRRDDHFAGFSGQQEVVAPLAQLSVISWTARCVLQNRAQVQTLGSKILRSAQKDTRKC